MLCRFQIASQFLYFLHSEWKHQEIYNDLEGMEYVNNRKNHYRSVFQSLTAPRRKICVDPKWEDGTWRSSRKLYQNKVTWSLGMVCGGNIFSTGQRNPK